VVKQVDSAELRILSAQELAAAADAVLVAHHLSKLCAHLVTALARLHVHNHARRSSLEAESTRDKRGVKGGEGHKKLRVKVRHGKQDIQWRARIYPKRATCSI